MAKLTIDMAAYTYGQGLKAISMMYLAAKGALEEQRREFGTMIDEYRKHVDAGGDPIGEWDEEGHTIWDQERDFRLSQLIIDDATAELGVATVIAIYHHWERSIPTQKGPGSRRHNDLVQGAEARSIGLHKDFDALLYCANYLKHGNQNYRTRLLEKWPDRFTDGSLIGEPHAPWDRRLTISSDTIDWFLEIARASERPVIALHDDA